MPSPDPLTLPPLGVPNPEGAGGKALQRLLNYARDCDQDVDDLWAFVAFAMARAKRSKAQLFQDLWAIWVSREKRDGYFVEFGATDGVYLSNTWLLETEMGWTGVLAEPNPAYAAGLAANRRCAISTRCVHSTSGRTIDFLAAPRPELSRMQEIDPEDKHEELRKGAEVIPVLTISLNDLLHEHQAPRGIDFMSVDTEGSELEILGALDFDRWRPGAIAVEHNGTANRERLLELLTDRGYRRMWPRFSGFDDWYVLN
jgi:FkbM family methyltransferase